MNKIFVLPVIIFIIITLSGCNGLLDKSLIDNTDEAYEFVGVEFSIGVDEEKHSLMFKNSAIEVYSGFYNTHYSISDDEKGRTEKITSEVYIQDIDGELLVFNEVFMNTKGDLFYRNVKNYNKSCFLDLNISNEYRSNLMDNKLMTYEIKFHVIDELKQITILEYDLNNNLVEEVVANSKEELMTEYTLSDRNNFVVFKSEYVNNDNDTIIETEAISITTEEKVVLPKFVDQYGIANCSTLTFKFPE